MEPVNEIVDVETTVDGPHTIPGLDKDLMLIGAIGSVDERLTTMEAQLAEIMTVVELVKGAMLAMQDHPMLKMFGKK